MVNLKELKVINGNGKLEQFFFFENIQSYSIVFHLDENDHFRIYSEYALFFPIEEMAKDYNLCAEFLSNLKTPDLSGKIDSLKAYILTMPIFIQDFGYRHIRAILLVLGLSLKKIGLSNNLSFLDFNQELEGIVYNRVLLKGARLNAMESQISYNQIQISILPLLNNPASFVGEIIINNKSFETIGSVFRYQSVDIESLEGKELDYNLLWDMYLAIELSTCIQMSELINTKPRDYLPEHYAISKKRDLEILSFLALITS